MDLMDVVDGEERVPRFSFPAGRSLLLAQGFRYFRLCVPEILEKEQISLDK